MDALTSNVHASAQNGRSSPEALTHTADAVLDSACVAGSEGTRDRRPQVAASSGARHGSCVPHWDEVGSEPLLAASDDDEDERNDRDDDPLLAPSPSGSLHRSSRTSRDILTTIRNKFPIGRQQQNPNEPPNKIRRVERSVRVRQHVRCHECNSKFGIDNACTNCNHERCKYCTRQPLDDCVRPMTAVATPSVHAKANASQLHGVNALCLPLEKCATQTTPLALMQPSRPRSPPENSHHSPARLASNAPSCTSETNMLLEVDDAADEADSDEGSLSTFLTQRRSQFPSRSGLRSVYNSKMQKDQQAFRQQHTVLSTNVQTTCHEDGRIPCTLCTHSTKHSRQSSDGSAGSQLDEESNPPTSNTSTSRVYSKPRRRVRYTCERCRSVFANHIRHCQECGHDRCDHCLRDPPRSSAAMPRLRSTPNTLVTAVTHESNVGPMTAIT